MPIIFTRGSLSARGAGTFAYIPPPPAPPPPGPPPPPPPPGPPPPGPVLQTVSFNFPGTYSWTAPAGVSSIINLVVAGGAGGTIPAYWAWSTQTIVSNITTLPGPNVTPGPTTYAEAGAFADGALAAIGSGGDRIASWPKLQIGTNLLGGTPLYWKDPVEYNSARVRGSAERSSGPWDNRSSDIANGSGEYWYIGVEVYVPESTTQGGPSSAFGYTAQGVGPNQPRDIVSAASVAVIPGQTYSIQVGGPNDPSLSGGVSFQFYQS